MLIAHKLMLRQNWDRLECELLIPVGLQPEVFECIDRLRRFRQFRDLRTLRSFFPLNVATFHPEVTKELMAHTMDATKVMMSDAALDVPYLQWSAAAFRRDISSIHHCLFGSAKDYPAYVWSGLFKSPHTPELHIDAAADRERNVAYIARIGALPLYFLRDRNRETMTDADRMIIAQAMQPACVSARRKLIEQGHLEKLPLGTVALFAAFASDGTLHCSSEVQEPVRSMLFNRDEFIKTGTPFGRPFKKEYF